MAHGHINDCDQSSSIPISRLAPAASEASHASDASEGERSEPSAHRHIRRATNRHIRHAKR